MIRMGPLGELMRVREDFIRIIGANDDPDLDRIDKVTSSANSRLGNPISFVLHDESGLYTTANKMRKTAETQRRGAAGMGGRSMETSNMFDPSENSVAQTTFNSPSKDIFKFYRKPPEGLSYKNKRDRRKIHEYVYRGSWWVDLDSIEGEAAELMEEDPEQAERFFGNRQVHGKGAWMHDEKVWTSTQRNLIVPDGTEVCLGFDGSDNNDHTGIRLRTLEGFRFTPKYGPDSRPTHWNPAEWGGSTPRGEVRAAVDEIFRRYKVIRGYFDPRDWQTEIGDWALVHGDTVVLEWATYRTTQMHNALVRALTDLTTSAKAALNNEPLITSHDDCPITQAHVFNARKIAKPGDRYLLAKPNDHQKIDMTMADVLANEAGEDAKTDPSVLWGKPKPTNYFYSA